MFTVVFTTAKIMEATQVSINRRADKEDVGWKDGWMDGCMDGWMDRLDRQMIDRQIDRQNGILHGHKKEILPFATWKDLESIVMLSEISQRKTNTR